MGIPVDTVYKKFQKLHTAAICDASPLAKTLNHTLIPIFNNIKMAGKALTVSCQNDYLTVIKAVEESKPGDVLVVDCQGQTLSVFGELLARESKRRKLAGVIIDGSIRDINVMRTIGIPVFYKQTNPQAGRAEVVEPPCSTVSIGGVVINSGDFILGDDDGIVIVPEQHIETIMEVAFEIKIIEDKVAKSISKGETLNNILELEEFRRDHEKEIRSRLDNYFSDRNDLDEK